MTHTAASVKTLPFPTIKRLLRERGLTFMDVAKLRKRSHSLVSRVVRKKAKSELVWQDIARVLNSKPNGRGR